MESFFTLAENDALSPREREREFMLDITACSHVPSHLKQHKSKVNTVQTIKTRTVNVQIERNTTPTI